MSDNNTNPLWPTQAEGAISFKGDIEIAVHEVKQQSELLPICAWCHQVRDDEGYWQRIEPDLMGNIGTNLTHGICPDCSNRVKNLEKDFRI